MDLWKVTELEVIVLRVYECRVIYSQTLIDLKRIIYTVVVLFLERG
jgi:hypothetical protein